MTDATHDPAAVHQLRAAFAAVTLEHDRLLMMLVDPGTLTSQFRAQLDVVREATADYLRLAHTAR